MCSSPDVTWFLTLSGTLDGRHAVTSARYSPFRNSSFRTRIATKMLTVARHAGRFGSWSALVNKYAHMRPALTSSDAVRRYAYVPLRSRLVAAGAMECAARGRVYGSSSALAGGQT